MKRTTALKRRSPMERGEPIRARRWGTKPSPKKPSWRDAYLPDRMAVKAPKRTAFELAWFSFVRRLGCCCAHLGGCRGTVQASHVATSANEKGVGMKVATTQTVPHCDRHHRAWDGRLGNTGNPFAGMNKADRYELAAEWVADVRLAAIPEDRQQAEHFEALGLGEILTEVQGSGWAWRPFGRELEAGQ